MGRSRVFRLAAQECSLIDIEVSLWILNTHRLHKSDQPAASQPWDCRRSGVDHVTSDKIVEFDREGIELFAFVMGWKEFRVRI